LTRGNSPKVVKQDTAQLRGKVQNRYYTKLQRNLVKTAQVTRRDKATREIW